MAAWHFVPAPPTSRRPRRPRPFRRPRRWWGRSWRLFVVVFALLLCARAVLPIGARIWVNHVLAGMQHYHGEVDGVHLNLWRGAYELDHLRIFKNAAPTPEPLVEMRRLDISVQWSGLLHGRIVAEAVCHHPVFEFALLRPQPATDPEQEEVTGKDEPWTLHLDDLVPFEINRCVIRDGEIRYRDDTKNPPVDLYVTDFYLEALNIANVRERPGEPLYAEVEAAGRPFGTAELEARMRFDPLSQPLRLELDMAVRKVQLTDLNDFLRAYGKVDAEAGTLGLYAEFATQDGQVEGYVKTLFDHMRLVRARDLSDPGSLVGAAWEGAVGLASRLVRNQPHDRLATKIPLRGTLSGTRPDLLATVGSLLGNAFLAALGPAIDDTISLRDMQIVERPTERAATRAAKD
jgi:hypothetical protein